MSILDGLRAERPDLTLQQRVERGREAEAMLQEDSLFREVLDEVELQTIETWRATTDEGAQKRAWSVVNALAEVENALHKMKQDGVVAEHQLEEQEG